MVRWLKRTRCSPIGLDIGSRSVKLVQFDAEHTRLIEAARWDLPPVEDDQVHGPERRAQVVDAINQAREGRQFHGRRVVLCLGDSDLMVQNIRIPKTDGRDLAQLVHQEAAGRVPFSMAEADIRFVDAADVRQGDALMREVVLMAAHHPQVEEKLQSIVAAGLTPVAVDVEPMALLRCYFQQYRRDEDRTRRVLYLHVGESHSVVVIAQGSEVLFVKYLDLGGRHMDQSVARHAQISVADAASLRRHNGDRRSSEQDPEVARSVAESVRPVIERLAGELSACIRYHSVTFRGQPLAQVVLSGGEASTALAEALSERLGMECDVPDPLRTYEGNPNAKHQGQWAIATGLALREVEN